MTIDTQKDGPGRIAGLDVGATRSRVAVVDGDNPPVEHHGPGFNLSVDDPHRVAAVLADLIASTMAGAGAGRPPARGDVCCVGIAGAGRREQARQLRLALAAVLGIPGTDVLVETDARVALEGAFGGEAGALILAGTGSGCHALAADGTYHRTGGWGPGIGDPGSGRSIGSAMIRLGLEVIERGDGAAGPETEFAASLARRLGASRDPVSILEAVYADGFAAASLAPFAFEWCPRWQPVESAVREECVRLCTQFARLRRRAGQTTDRVAVRGGLTQEPVWMRLFTEALGQAAPGVELVSPSGRPIDGALRIAGAHQQRSV
ncbi:MAG: hypothetical protein HKN17_01865 [Rhodothermales bacterium]|nr:hypothetical protein [Rhodothermales bacterium]